MSDFSNRLTPAEDERLAFLVEEFGESLQIIGKINRHGYESSDPLDDDGHKQTNRQMLAKEIGDTLAVIELMRNELDLDDDLIEARIKVKLIKLRHWCHHNHAQIEKLIAERKDL